MAHQKVCTLKGCPHPTHGRLRDQANQYRRDLCCHHFFHTKKHYGDQVVAVEEWCVEENCEVKDASAAHSHA